MRSSILLIRLMLVFLLVITPIFCIGVYMYQTGMQSIQGQVLYQHAQQLKFILSDLSSQYERVQYEISLIKRDTNFTRLISMPDSMSPYELSRALNTLQSRISTIDIGSNCVERILVYLPETMHRICSNEGPDKIATIQNVNSVEIHNYIAIANKTLFAIRRIDGTVYYADQMPYPLQMLPSELPRMLFLVEFDEEYLASNFSEISQNEDVRYILAKQNGAIVSSNMSFPEHIVKSLLKIQTAKYPILESDGIKYYIISRDDTPLDLKCILMIPLSTAADSLKPFQYSIWLLTLLMGIALLLYGIYSYRQIHRPMIRLLNGYTRLEHGDMDFQVNPTSSNELNLLTVRFNEMLCKLRESMTQLNKQRQLAQQAELKQLQSQINPHFLYNCFYLLNNMISLGDEENALFVSKRLGQYFQYVTRDERFIVPLCEEVMHARSYLDIQKIRFGQRLNLHIDTLPLDYENAPVPRLMLQPLLENAFKHALENAEKGMLSVRFLECRNTLKILIENDGPIDKNTIDDMIAKLQSEQPKGETTGLINVHQRLKLTHNTGLEIAKREPSGLILTITIQKEGIDHAETDIDCG